MNRLTTWELREGVIEEACRSYVAALDGHRGTGP
jgi:hypothetical protein